MFIYSYYTFVYAHCHYYYLILLNHIVPKETPGVQLRYWSKDQVQELFYALGISGKRLGGRADTKMSGGPNSLGARAC